MSDNLNKLLSLNLKRLEKYISHRINNPAEAEEIVQETLISAVYSYSGFRENSSFFTWLCGIANHEISDYYRKKKIKTVLFSVFPWLEELADEALGPEQILLKKEIEGETEKKVRASLACLCEGYREILRLKYYRGLTVIEIAKKLNESVKATESKLFRARKAFAKVFTAEFS